MDEDLEPEYELARILHEYSEEDSPAVLKAQMTIFAHKWGKKRALEAIYIIILAKLSQKFEDLGIIWS